MSQKVRISQNRHYQFSLSFMGDNTTGIKVEMYICLGSNKIHYAIFPEGLWHEHSVDIEITEPDSANVELEVELKMDSSISYGVVKSIRLICK